MKQKVLIVEDDPRNLKLVQALLTAHGYWPVTALDGPSAITTARAEQPDLILMDMQLPVMDGIEAIRILRGDPCTADIPILAVTALAMKGDRERILNAGCNGYVSKPIRLEELLRAIALQLHPETVS
jgi:two-component system cell cycle response regulator DivK